jgi:hypothetical protein
MNKLLRSFPALPEAPTPLLLEQDVRFEITHSGPEGARGQLHPVRCSSMSDTVTGRACMHSTTTPNYRICIRAYIQDKPCISNRILVPVTKNSNLCSSNVDSTINMVYEGLDYIESYVCMVIMKTIPNLQPSKDFSTNECMQQITDCSPAVRLA